MGKLVAALVFTGLVALVVYGMVTSQGSSSAPPRGFDGPTPQPRPTDGILGSIEGSVFQSFDPVTGDLRYELEWEILDPVGQGRYELTAPVATFYQRDRVVEVRAAEGRLLWPSRDQEPESGNLTGEVTITVRENDGSGGGEVAGVLTTPSLFFQSVLGELNAPEVVRIEAPGIEFEGRGLTARISELQRRVQYLRVDEHLGTTVWPDRLGGSNDNDDPEDRSPAVRAEQPELAEGAEQAPELIDLYRVSFSNAFRLAQGQRAVSADEADVWVRLRDRKLASGAIAPLVVGSTTPERERRNGSGGGSGERAEAGPEEASQPIRFENAGPIEVVPLLNAPAQLSADDLAARFRATESSAVVMRDEESGAMIRCGSIQWGFTSRQLAVRGVGGLLGVEFDFPGQASVRAGAVDLDLAEGIASFAGAGRVSIEAAASGRSTPTSIGWSERADVVLDTSSVAARSSSRPLVRWLTAAGSIEARTETATVTGGFIRADFGSSMANGEARNDLNRVSVREGAAAMIRDGDVAADVSASRLDVLLAGASGGTRIVPTRASASGDAVAVVNGDRLAGQTIDAVLAVSDDERTSVQSIDASGDVTLRTREGLDLAASTMHASERTGTLTLVGYPATAGVYTDAQGRGASGRGGFAEGFSITGESMRFEREERMLTVFGGGVLSYAALNPQTGGYDNGGVRWQRSMRFDDRTGSAEFVGGVTASARSTQGAEYEMEGERVELTLTPDLLDEQASGPLRAAGSGAGAVLAVRLEAVPGQRARAEALQYARSDGERVLETAARLSGERIIAERDAERVLVPGAGRLVLEDRRAGDESDEPGALPVDGRGTTVFDWEGSLEAAQTERSVVMSRGVRMRHLQRGTQTLTVVETEQLTATVEEGATIEDGARYVLDSVEAEGAVLATHGESQVVADRLSYSREAARIVASALQGNRVTFYDAESGRHIPAERVILDLLTGRWRVEQAGQIVAPLGPSAR